jgi:heme o synthase
MVSRTVARMQLTALVRLVRLPLTLMVTGTALAGALALRAPLPGLTLWALGWGVFLLTAASSVLNQVQERSSDALMRRTAGRPLACGQLAPRAGIAIGLLLGSGGLAVLAVGTGPSPALLGLAALTWYLAIYTPLKRVTSLAVLAGTPCGAVPPLLGWLAAGGPLPAAQPLALALVMLLWQVPHYWLLALPDREELRAAGFRVLPELSDRQLLAVCHRWLLGVAAATLSLIMLGLVQSRPLQLVLGGAALLLAVHGTRTAAAIAFPAATARRLRIALLLHLALLLLTLLLDVILTNQPG